MTEDQAIQVALVRSIETTIPPSGAWNAADRRAATEDASREVGTRASDEAFVERRAAQVAKRLCERSPAVARALRRASWHPGAARLLVALSLLVGLATDSIGHAQRINLLAPPIWGVLAWNLLVYAGLLAGSLGAASSRAHPYTGPISRTFDRALRTLSSFPTNVFRPHRERSAHRDLDTALLRFSRDWAQTSASLTTRRLAGLMHLCALSLTTGVLAGLYLRGLALEYRAGWESTFLGADALASMLGTLLGPASSLSGIELPDAARLESMRFPDSKGEPAGPWIHLFAITAALVVILPRALLWMRCRSRERTLARRFPLSLDDAWFAGLARARRGESRRILLLQHGSTLDEPALTALRGLIGNACGDEISLEITLPVAEGYEEDLPDALDDPARWDLILIRFAATATPEAETHGALLDSMLLRLAPGRPLLVIVDETTFVERFGASLDPSSRRSQRRNAWTQLLAAPALRLAFIDLGVQGAALDEQIEALRQAIAGLAVTG